MDRDQNGYIDADDLVDCMVDLAQEQQQRRLWFAFALVSLITTLVCPGAAKQHSLLAAGLHWHS
jgi:hypothetical protein